MRKRKKALFILNNCVKLQLWYVLAQQISNQFEDDFYNELRVKLWLKEAANFRTTL